MGASQCKTVLGSRPEPIGGAAHPSRVAPAGGSPWTLRGRRGTFAGGSFGWHDGPRAGAINWNRKPEGGRHKSGRRQTGKVAAIPSIRKYVSLPTDHIKT
jgi:hypothetical protein